MTLLDQFARQTHGLFLVNRESVRAQQELYIRQRVAEWREAKARKVARQERNRRLWAAVAVVAGLILMVIG